MKLSEYSRRLRVIETIQWDPFESKVITLPWGALNPPLRSMIAKQASPIGCMVGPRCVTDQERIHEKIMERRNIAKFPVWRLGRLNYVSSINFLV